MEARRAGALLVPGIVLLAALHLGSVPAAAQTDTDPLLVSGDLVLGSEYVWRGLVRANRPTLQADLYATGSLGSHEVFGATLKEIGVTAGGWTAVQFGGGGGDRFGDLESTGVPEINPWLQLGARAGALDLAFGVTRYFYRGNASLPFARTDAASTTELFGRLGIRGRRVSWGLTWWQDVEEVVGAYVETGVSLNLPLIPIPLPIPLLRVDPTFGNLFFDVTAGWSDGQGINASDPGQAANFSGDGLTHLEFTMSTSLLFANAISLDPAIHVQVSRDDRAKRTAPGSSSGQHVWFSVALRPLKLFGVGGGSP